MKVARRNVEFSLQATPQEIDRAFRQLSRKFHPDRHSEEERKRDAEAHFARLQRAHDG